MGGLAKAIEAISFNNLVERGDDFCFPRLTAARTRFGSAVHTKGLGISVCLGDEAVDGELQVDDGIGNTPRLRRRRVSLAKKLSRPR